MESRLLFAGGPPSRLLAVANNKLANKCWPALTWRLTAPSAKKKKKKEGEGRGESNGFSESLLSCASYRLLACYPTVGCIFC